ncbi:hypothetical protein MNAN1_003382 [Malassezia nana]|uniref:Conserved oligomeric Golgi complex subunit 2 n=1 Tax=Malassezia nana TaxID=180528 RepID=A0AAF0J3U3_9BASI|nr:hypothetical protein MNAN1_003382 [Malassezia nana]
MAGQTNEGLVPGLEMPQALGPGMPLLSLEKQPQFDVDAFLCSRAVGQDAPSILKELRGYKHTLQNHLVQMINDKYRDFVSLSKMLNAESERFKSLTDPTTWLRVQDTLGDMRSRVTQAQADMESLLQEQRRDNEERNILKMLLELERAVLRLEVLAGIQPDTYEPSLQRSQLCQWAHLEDEVDAPSHVSPSGDDAVISYTLEQRVYHAYQSYAWIQKLLSRPWPAMALPFLMEMKPRLEHIYKTLCDDTLFLSSSLEKDIRTSLSSSDGLAKDRMTLLRLVFDISIELGGECVAKVLEQIRSSCIAPMVHACFDAPAPSQNELDENVYTNTGELAEIRAITHLDDWTVLSPASAAPLRQLYNALLCVAHRLSFVYQVAEHVGGASLDVFNDILWNEMVTTLVEKHGSHLFFVGKPNEFHRNYILTQAWVERMCAKAPSARAKQAFKKHEATLMLDRRWQLSAFFHLRTREMVGALDQALRHNTGRATDFYHPALAHLLHACIEPWTANRHVPLLRAREWRLTLHVVSRYRTWLAQQLPAKSNYEGDSVPAAQPGVDSAGFTQEELGRLNAACGLWIDVPEFESRLRAVADCIIFPKLLGPVSPQDQLESEALCECLKQVLEESLGALAEVEPAVTDMLLSVLKRRCAVPLRHVRAGNSQYRPFARGGKEEITSSPFIPMIVQPLQQLAGETSGTPFRRLPRDKAQAIVQDVLDSTVVRYASAVDTVTRNLESLRRLKRGSMGTSKEAGADEVVL